MKVIWALAFALLLTGTTAAVSVASSTGNEPSGEAAAALPVVGYADPVAPHGFFWQLFAPQPVVPGSYLYAAPVGEHHRHTSKGTRSDEQFFEISRTGSNDVPEAALRAYKHAASAMAKTDPGCQISWTLLAAIGRVESNHGRFGGSELGSDGISRPAIVGPRLDGAGPFAAIADSDDGTLDGDKKWDRAVGQMQFLPSTWRSVARDGDGDGTANPGDLDDSALTSAIYLCGAGNLSTDAGMARAAYRYNQSDYYVALVLAFAHGYQTGVFVLPSPPPPPGQDNKAAAVTQVADTRGKKPKAPKTSAGTTGTTGTAKPTPTKAAVTPSSAPTPTRPTASPAAPKPRPSTGSSPSPSPSPTPSLELETVSGAWAACDGGYCLAGLKLDLGDGRADNTAAADFDGANGVQTNGLEFAGLVGQTVSVQVKKGTGVVYVVAGKDYRNADGSFRQ